MNDELDSRISLSVQFVFHRNTGQLPRVVVWLVLLLATLLPQLPELSEKSIDLEKKNCMVRKDTKTFKPITEQC